MKICDKDEISELEQYGFTNALCIEDLSQLMIKGSWWGRNYDIPYFLLSECKNYEGKQHPCAAQEKILKEI